MNKSQETEALLRELGMTAKDFQLVMRARTRDEAVRLLEEVRAKFRSAYRKMAFALHPDRTGGDPVKTRKFQALIQLREEVEKLSIPEPPPPEPQQTVVVVSYFPDGKRSTTAVRMGHRAAVHLAGMTPGGVPFQRR